MTGSFVQHPRDLNPILDTDYSIQRHSRCKADSIQRQSRCKDHVYVPDTINAADMDETYGTYVDDECFDIHDYDDDDDDDTDDDTEDDTNDDTNDDTDDGGRGHLYTIKVLSLIHI